jgi:hypothetical protein
MPVKRTLPVEHKVLFCKTGWTVQCRRRGEAGADADRCYGASGVSRAAVLRGFMGLSGLTLSLRTPTPAWSEVSAAASPTGLTLCERSLSVNAACQ